MARRKPKVVEQVVQTEPEPLSLTVVELLQMERLAAVLRATKAERTTVSAMRRAFIQAIDPKNQIGGFDFQLSSIDRESTESQKALEDLRKAVESRLGIDLKNYAYDDVSGRLRELPQDPQPENKKE